MRGIEKVSCYLKSKHTTSNESRQQNSLEKAAKYLEISMCCLDLHEIRVFYFTILCRVLRQKMQWKFMSNRMMATKTILILMWKFRAQLKSQINFIFEYLFILKF